MPIEKQIEFIKQPGDIIVSTMNNIAENNQKNLRLVDETIRALKAVEGISLITKTLGCSRARDIRGYRACIIQARYSQDVGEIKRYLDHIEDIVKKWKDRYGDQ